MAALLAARADGLLPKALTDTIVTRSEGNPFFAEELLAAAREAIASSSPAASPAAAAGLPARPSGAEPASRRRGRRM